MIDHEPKSGAKVDATLAAIEAQLQTMQRLLRKQEKIFVAMAVLSAILAIQALIRVFS